MLAINFCVSCLVLVLFLLIICGGRRRHETTAGTTLGRLDEF